MVQKNIIFSRGLGNPPQYEFRVYGGFRRKGGSSVQAEADEYAKNSVLRPFLHCHIHPRLLFLKYKILLHLHQMYPYTFHRPNEHLFRKQRLNQRVLRDRVLYLSVSGHIFLNYSYFMLLALYCDGLLLWNKISDPHSLYDQTSFYFLYSSSYHVIYCYSLDYCLLLNVYTVYIHISKLKHFYTNTSKLHVLFFRISYLIEEISSIMDLLTSCHILVCFCELFQNAGVGNSRFHLTIPAMPVSCTVCLCVFPCKCCFYYALFAGILFSYLLVCH